MEGVHRFLGRAWRLVVGLPLSGASYPEGSIATDSEPTKDQLRTLHQCINKVSFRNTVLQKLCFTYSR